MAALIGKPTLAALTTLEMTPEEFDRFRKVWIRSKARELMWEGISAEMAILTAKNDFKQEQNSSQPWSKRNDHVRRNRRLRRDDAERATAQEVAKNKLRRQQFLAQLKEAV